MPIWHGWYFCLDIITPCFILSRIYSQEWFSIEYCSFLYTCWWVYTNIFAEFRSVCPFGMDGCFFVAYNYWRFCSKIEHIFSKLTWCRFGTYNCEWGFTLDRWKVLFAGRTTALKPVEAHAYWRRPSSWCLDGWYKSLLDLLIDFLICTVLNCLSYIVKWSNMRSSVYIILILYGTIILVWYLFQSGSWNPAPI